MTALFVSAVFAIWLLPNLSVGNGRESWTATSNRACTILSLCCHVSGEGIVVVSTKVILVGICQNRYRSSHCYHNCKNKNHLFHCHIPWFVSGATSNYYYCSFVCLCIICLKCHHVREFIFFLFWLCYHLKPSQQ